MMKFKIQVYFIVSDLLVEPTLKFLVEQNQTISIIFCIFAKNCFNETRKNILPPW